MKLSHFAFLPVLLALPLALHAQTFTSPRLEADTSWIGNTFGGGKKWVQQDIHALAVMPDGTVFTNVPWDEAGGNGGEYRDGELLRYALHTHGWGANGGDAVAANSRYLFLGMQMDNENGGLKDPDTWPPKGSRWQGISRRTRAESRVVRESRVTIVARKAAGSATSARSADCQRSQASCTMSSASAAEPSMR